MERGYTIPVLDKGYVRYISHLGTDLSIVESARISYHSPSKGDDGDRKLLHYLYKNHHASPFEQVNVTLNIKMPIFVMRQFVRHRTFRLNEMSARYTEMWDDFYLPEKLRVQDTKNKQGSIGELTKEQNDSLIGEMNAFYDESYKLYKKLLDNGVAREMARFVLPVSNYTEIYVNIDLRNLMHFLGLRLDAHAQYEIRVFAEAMRDIAKELFPWSMEAFERYQFKLEDKNEA